MGSDASQWKRQNQRWAVMLSNQNIIPPVEESLLPAQVPYSSLVAGSKEQAGACIEWVSFQKLGQVFHVHLFLKCSIDFSENYAHRSLWSQVENNG